MSSNLLIAYPDIAAAALVETSDAIYFQDTPAAAAIQGKRHCLAQLAVETTGGHCVEYDLGASNSSTASYLALARADILQQQGCTSVALKGSDASRDTPSSIAGLTLWLRSDTGVTSASAAVSAWEDQSGICADFAQSTASKKPTRKSIANGINGYPVLNFDGSADQLASSSTVANIFAAGACTIFAAVKTTSGTGPILADNLGFFHLGITGATSASLFLYDGAGATASASWAHGSLAIIEARHESGNIYIKVNNGAETVVACGNITNLTSTLTIGYSAAGVDYLNGSVGEIIAYNTALTSAERLRIYNYLAARWQSAPLVNTNFRAETLIGPTKQDWIETFTTSAAHRYWWLEFGTDAAPPNCEYGRSKNLFGSFWDPGVDPVYQYEMLEGNDGTLELSSGSQCLTTVDDMRYKFTLQWQGVTDALIKEFEEKILADPDNRYVFLYANGNEQILAGTSLAYCRVVADECSIQKSAKKDYGYVRGVFEQVAG